MTLTSKHLTLSSKDLLKPPSKVSSIVNLLLKVQSFDPKYHGFSYAIAKSKVVNSSVNATKMYLRSSGFCELWALWMDEWIATYERRISSPKRVVMQHDIQRQWGGMLRFEVLDRLIMSWGYQAVKVRVVYCVVCGIKVHQICSDRPSVHRGTYVSCGQSIGTNLERYIIPRGEWPSESADRVKSWLMKEAIVQ